MFKLPLPEEVDFTSSISPNGDALCSTLTKGQTGFFQGGRMHNNVRIQGMYDATHELLHHTAVFEPQYLMDMVETAKERLPSDFYVKICALAKLYHDEKECLEKRLKTMRELFPAISETSSSTSEVVENPYLHGLSSREVAERRQQTPLRPSIRGGIHSFKIHFHCGLYPIHESIFHCLCGKILYGNWQIQCQ